MESGGWRQRQCSVFGIMKCTSRMEWGGGGSGSGLSNAGVVSNWTWEEEREGRGKDEGRRGRRLTQKN